MRNFQKGIAVPFIVLIIASVLLVAGGAYFIFHSRAKTDIQAESTDSVQVQVEAAQAAADKERAKLYLLEQKYNAEHPVNTSFRDQYLKLASIVKKTDIFFSFRTPSDPQLKIKTKTPDIASDLNSRRKQIGAMLTSLKSKSDLSLTREVNADSLLEIKTDAQFIDVFVKKLKDLFDSLTPESSGLTQPVIDEYRLSLQSGAAEASNALALSKNASTTSSVTVPSKSVTESDIERQQNILNQALALLTALQQKLGQTTTKPQTQPTNTFPQQNNSYQPSAPQSAPIIIKSGKPQLIQGDNRY